MPRAFALFLGAWAAQLAACQPRAARVPCLSDASCADAEICLDGACSAGTRAALDAGLEDAGSAPFDSGSLGEGEGEVEAEGEEAEGEEAEGEAPDAGPTPFVLDADPRATAPAGYLGGLGGDGPVTLACPSGAVATGLATKQAGLVDALDGIFCRHLATDGSLGAQSFILGHVGGTGGDARILLCPQGQAIVGIFGTDGPEDDAVLGRLGARCARPEAWRATGAFESSANFPSDEACCAMTVPSELLCPASSAAMVTSVQGFGGSFLDSVTLVCSALDPSPPR